MAKTYEGRKCAGARIGEGLSEMTMTKRDEMQGQNSQWGVRDTQTRCMRTKDYRVGDEEEDWKE